MRKDIERLRAEFYGAFDRSRLEALLTQEPRQLAARHELLGEGAHFAAWRVQGTALVVKIARPEFAGPGTPGFRRWSAALAAVRGMGGLVPPFELLAAGDRIGMAMPYGTGPFAAAAAHWQPLADRVAELDAALARLGLELADVAQGRTWQAVPFIFDLSDLGPLTRPR